MLKPLLFIFVSILTHTVIADSSSPNKILLLHATQVFDGEKMLNNTSILIENGIIKEVAPRDSFKAIDTSAINIIDLGNATLLPGFIELHAHVNYRQVPTDIVLQHGITTVRDLGGAIHFPRGGNGKLRLLSAGPILTVENGYPINKMGKGSHALAIRSEAHAKQIVQRLIENGAVIIKIALEAGGEVGAPWSSAHHHHQNQHSPASSHHSPTNTHHVASATTWPMLSETIVKAIVSEAHKLGIKVTAHVGEQQGVKIALNAGVDEWAHMPCAVIPKALLAQAVAQKVNIVTTLDTLSKCTGIAHNTTALAELGANFLYGAEIAHPDIPWGIDAQELMSIQQHTQLSFIEVLKTATSKAGKYLNIPLLGQLKANAPADIIAVKGELAHSFKKLEYPQLVISGGHIIKNNF